MVLLVVLGLVFGGITTRLVWLQGFGSKQLSALGQDQRVRTVTLSAERGSVFDRNGIDLALSVPQDTVWADPRMVRDPSGSAAKLAPILDVDAAEIESLLAKSDTAFVYLARKVEPEVAEAVRALELVGIELVPESKRHYPAEGLAASLLGFTGIDNDGLGGLEAAYDDVLSGTSGELIVEQDPQGHEIPSSQRRYLSPQRGSDLVLTIDQSLQHEVEEVLVEQVGATSAIGGTAIVADVKTGDVLAMATVDGPDGDSPARPADKKSRNRAFTDVFEPGSTNKVMTVAGALEEGIVGPDTVFQVGAQISVGGEVFEEHDWHAVVGWSVADILRESSNVGTIQIGLQLGKDRLDHYLRAFGLGRKTAIDFPGEAPGILLAPEDYSATSIATVPMGQGLAVTPMQLLEVYATIANGGMAREPRLVTAIVDSEGVRRNESLGTEGRVVSSSTAAMMTTMLVEVVTAGTGKRAAIEGYTVAGKTGTAQQTQEGLVGYVAGAFDASFVGFAPAEDPRLVAIVILNRPQPYFGGLVAAPVFARIMREALRMERIAPSGSLQFEEAAAALEAAAAADAAQEAAEEAVEEAAAVSTASADQQAATLASFPSPSG